MKSANQFFRLRRRHFEEIPVIPSKIIEFSGEKHAEPFETQLSLAVMIFFTLIKRKL